MAGGTCRDGSGKTKAVERFQRKYRGRPWYFFFRFSGAERPLPRFDGLKRSMRGFDGTSLQVVEIAAGITMHVIGQIVICIKYWEKDWGNR